MAENNEMMEKANKLFGILSSKDMSAEQKAEVAAMIQENPNILTSTEFMRMVAPVDMNKCPKEGAGEYIGKASEQLKLTTQVLDNLQSMDKDGTLGKVKNGKSQLQNMLDEGRLPNGETVGTQTIKNIVYLRALQNDDTYPDKAGSPEYLADSQAFLAKVYSKNDYGANPNRRNAMGQKAGELMESHLDPQSGTRNLKVDDLKRSPAQLTREDLELAAYRGTISVEDKEKLDQMRKGDEKVADVKGQAGDVQRSDRKPSDDKFKDEDVVKYMYENWLLGGASKIFNKIEDLTLGIIDDGCNIFVESVRQRYAINEEQAAITKEARDRVAEFGGVFEAVRAGRGDAYDKKAENYQKLFGELGKVIADPSYKSEHDFDPDFIAKLRADPNAAEFVKHGNQAVASQISILKATDELALLMTSVQMTDEMMSDPKAWLNSSGKPKSPAELQADLETRSTAQQKKLLQAIAVVSEDARLMAEMAYDKLPDPKPDLNAFIEAQIKADVNSFVENVAKQTKEAAAKQQKEVAAGNFKGRGNKSGPSTQVKTKLDSANELIDATIAKGTIYTAAEFADEKSTKRTAATCSLYEEAKAQNMPSVFERIQELNGYNQEMLNARRTDVNARRTKLEAMKTKLAERDGQSTIDKRIADYIKNQSRA